MADLRNERGWTQADLAWRMKVMGCNWTANRVTQVETLRGKVSLYEVVALTWLFEVPMTRLLAGDDNVEFPNGEGSVYLGKVRAALTGDNSIQVTARDQSQVWRQDMEEIRKIAKGLGIFAGMLDWIAREKWGHAFTVERDERAGDVSGLPKRAASAKRGHATRAMIAEVREHIERVGEVEIFRAYRQHQIRRHEAVVARVKATEEAVPMPPAKVDAFLRDWAERTGALTLEQARKEVVQALETEETRITLASLQPFVDLLSEEED